MEDDKKQLRGDPVVINLEEARKRIRDKPEIVKDITDDKKERVLSCLGKLDQALKEERCQLQVSPQLEFIGSGIFKIGGLLMVKAL